MRLLLAFMSILCVACVSNGQRRNLESCLPQGFKMEDIVSVEATTTTAQAKRVTVKQRLATLKARCRNNKLVDARNREIKLYRLQGCWGNAPENYQEILDKQRRELVELKKKYTVIEISCNPSGDDIPIPSAPPAP